MKNNYALCFALILLIIELCAFAYSVYKCGQLKDEINKEINKMKRKDE